MNKSQGYSYPEQLDGHWFYNCSKGHEGTVTPNAYEKNQNHFPPVLYCPHCGEGLIADKTDPRKNERTVV